MRFLLVYLSFTCFFLVSCRDASELYPPTSIEIMDPVRHYYPVVQGEKFEIYIQGSIFSRSPMYRLLVAVWRWIRTP